MSSARAGLYREYARVIEMCEGTDVAPASCVRLLGHVPVIPLQFDAGVEEYSFAVSIAEGTPVFHGDTVFIRTPEKGWYLVGVTPETAERFKDCKWSWAAPKREPAAEKKTHLERELAIMKKGEASNLRFIESLAKAVLRLQEETDRRAEEVQDLVKQIRLVVDTPLGRGSLPEWVIWARRSITELTEPFVEKPK